MRGVVFEPSGTVGFKDFPSPRAGPGEAVVRVRASGICGTDLQMLREPQAGTVVSGHEACGDIVELAAAAPPGLHVGDRVMVYHYVGCGVCELCALGFEQGCPNRLRQYGRSANGGNAPYMLAAARTLIPLPDELSYNAGAALACGTGTAWAGLRKMRVSGLDSVAIFGQGPVGLSGTLIAKAMGARVLAVDVADARLDLARTAGADHAINARDADAALAIRELTGGKGATSALETSGSASARVQALQSLRALGQCCLVGMGHDPTPIDVTRDVILKSQTIFGSWTFTKAELIQAESFIVDARVPLDTLITHCFSFDEARRGVPRICTRTEWQVCLYRLRACDRGRDRPQRAAPRTDPSERF